MRTYNVLIVDDSIWIREGLIKTIDWDKIGVNIVGEAEDGHEALSIIDCSEVDIVISDIKMDYLDGLSLSKKINEKYPNIQVIIITGYDEFEFARKALRYGVSDYILKPIKEKILIKAVEKCIGVIKEKEENKEKNISIENHFKKSIPYLRQELFCNIFSGSPYIHEELRGEFSTLDIQITKELIKVYILKTNRVNDTFLTLYQICKKQLEDIEDIEIIQYKTDQVVIVASQDENKQNDFYKQIFLTLVSICNHISEKYNQSITIGVGKSYCNYDKIYKSYMDALETFSVTINEGERQVIKDVVAYIKSNYSIDLSLDMVSEHVMLNPCYLSKLFKEEMNISFSKYLINIRLEEAKKLLRNSNLKVYEISELVGYPNYRYFSRIFKKVEKCTPIEYRDANY